MNDETTTEQVVDGEVLDPKAVAGKAGGIARRESLDPARRSEIARLGGKARQAAGPPKATHVGPLRLGEIAIPAAVLDDGRRVLSQQGFLEAIGRARAAKGGQGAQGGVDETPAFLAANNLKPFISSELLASTTPIPYITTSGARAFGYRAELLSDVCWVFINAGLAGKLTHNQEHISKRCQILVRAFGKVGIIALVDEATGFQADRDAADLQRILEEYIVEEMRPWVRTFPSDFLRQIYRLHGWDYRPGDTRTPRYVGKFINKYVYGGLPPNVLPTLRDLNPVVGARRKYKHFQFLSDDTGNPHLAEQIRSVGMLMKAADNKAAFERAWRRVFAPQTEMEFTQADESEP